MKFNKLQKTIAVFFFLSIAATGVVPPWIRIVGQNGLESAIGFSSVFFPPDFPAVRVDFVRLIIIWIVISAVTLAAMLLANEKVNKR